MAAATKVVPVGGAKNGKERRVPLKKAPRTYSAVQVSTKTKGRTAAKPCKLRESITPGTVLILVAGKFAGRRVVFLKQLASGLLLVTGPYKVNGVPLKRVSQAYVIATQTKVDISSLNLDASISDATFKKAATKSAAKKASFFAEAQADKKSKLAAERKALQASVDAQLVALIKKTPMLKSYLATSFSLKKGQTLHAMKF